MGISIANRTRPEVINLIGFFANLLVVKTNFSRDRTVGDLLADVHANLVEAYEHQYFSFDSLVEKLNPRRNYVDNPLINVVYTYQQFDHHAGRGLSAVLADGGTLAGVSITPFLDDTYSHTSKFDLILFVTEQNGTLKLSFEYNKSLFAPATIVTYLGYFQRIFSSFIYNH
jgi:non-ribosomal peptide synthetase component F